MINKIPPTNNKELEKQAAVNSEAREELRKVVVATSKYQAEIIIELRKLNTQKLQEMVNAGMTAFDQAFNVYLKNGRIAKVDSNFSSYFGWWARQAIVAYLEPPHY